MADDLAPASVAEFVTALTFPEEGDVLAAAWAGAVAGNTGWLAYQPALLHHQRHVNEDGTDIRPVYLSAGSYTIAGMVAINSGGTGAILFDGTALVAGSSADAATFTGAICGWYLASAAWVDITVNYTAAGGVVNSAVVSAVGSFVGYGS